MLLIPDIKAHFRRRLTPQKCRLLSQFDQVSEVSIHQFLTPSSAALLQDMGSHCREINKKLLNIMTDLISRQLARVSSQKTASQQCDLCSHTQWEMKQPTPSQGFKTITKQLVKLHEALEDIVPPHHLMVCLSKPRLSAHSW